MASITLMEIIGMAESRIKLLHVITGLSTGGAELMLYKLLSGIDRRKFDCHVISLTDEGVVGAKIKTLGIPVEALGMRSKLPDPLRFIRLVRKLKQLQPDIVQTWLYHADLLGGLAARLSGVNTVVWNIRHNNLDKAINKWHTRMTAKLCALLSGFLANAIICNSSRSATLHQEWGYRTGLFKLIGNGFDLTSFRPQAKAKQELCQQLQIVPDSMLVGLVARFDPQKDHDNFIRAAGTVLKYINNVHFILIGTDVDDNNTALQQWLEATGFRQRFHLLGERTDIARLTAALDIACSSSLGEGFPNAIGEAMACAVPCIVTDVGDSAQLLGDTGTVVAPGDASALAEAMIALLQETEAYRNSLGKKARLRIEKHFSLLAIVKQYQDFYLGLYNNQ